MTKILFSIPTNVIITGNLRGNDVTMDAKSFGSYLLRAELAEDLSKYSKYTACYITFESRDQAKDYLCSFLSYDVATEILGGLIVK